MAEITPITTYDAVLGQVLVTLRVSKGLKQGDLATVVGIGPSTWSRIEKGESALSIGQLNLAAKALSVSAHQILDATEIGVKEAEAKGVRVEPSGTNLKGILQAENSEAVSLLGPGKVVGSTTLASALAGGIVLGTAIPVVGSLLGGVIGTALGAYFAKKND